MVFTFLYFTLFRPNDVASAKHKHILVSSIKKTFALNTYHPKAAIALR